MKVLATVILIAAAQFALAQDRWKNTYKVGISTIFFGSGDLRGLNLSTEYNRRLSNYVTFAPSIHVGYGARQYVTTELNSAKKSVAINSNLFFSPMRFERSKIRIGIGPSVRYKSGSTGIGRYNQYGEIQSGKHWTVGYSVVVEGEFVLTNRWLIGIGGGIQPYLDGDIVSYFGINTGYRF